MTKTFVCLPARGHHILFMRGSYPYQWLGAAKDDIVKEPKIPQATKAAMTDSAAKFIIESERIQQAKKMERLKQARLQMEASMPPAAPDVAKPAKRGGRVTKAI